MEIADWKVPEGWIFEDFMNCWMLVFEDGHEFMIGVGSDNNFTLDISDHEGRQYDGDDFPTVEETLRVMQEISDGKYKVKKVRD